MNDTVNVNDSSSKKKVLIGIIIAIIVLAVIGCGIFALNKGADNSSEPDTYSNVSDTSENSIRFKDTSLTLKVGETVTLELIFESEDGKNADVEFKSDDPAVAEVDEQGRLTGIASGSTVVKASLKSDSTVTALLNVTVTDDDTDTSENKTVEKSSDTVSSKKESEKSSDTKTKSKAENTSSAATSSKPDSDKENVSSTASKIEVTSSGTAESRTVSVAGIISSNNTVTQNTNVSSTTENTSTQTEEKNNYSSEVIPNTSEYIDPYSVGKSIPISFVGTEEKKSKHKF